jgi:hypothetical protein
MGLASVLHWATGAVAEVLLGPLLGGLVPGATPGPTVVPGPGVPSPDGTDISALLIIGAGLYAILGFFLGLRAQFYQFVVIGGLYFMLNRLWGLIAEWINHFYKLFVFAIIQRGIFVEDPTTVWKGMANFKDPVPTSPQEAQLWQLAIFGFGVLMLGFVLPYIWIRLHQPLSLWISPTFLERLLGLLVGAVNGWLIGLFVLPRVIPGAQTSLDLLQPGSSAREFLAKYGWIFVAVFVALIILYGVRSLGPGRGKRVYS